MRTQFGVLLWLSLSVVCSDAWFWTWTETTTLAPSVDHEGSGSPAGSGEPPPENIGQVGPEIIDEGHVIRKAQQTWDETTEAPRLTTVTQPEPGRASEKGTSGSSAHPHKPGNDTSSIKGMGSDHLRFTGLESELAGSSDRSDLWSDSGPEANSETQGLSEESQEGEAMPTDYKGLFSGAIADFQTDGLKFQNSSWINQSERYIDYSATGNERELNNSFSWDANDFNVTGHDALAPLETTQAAENNQVKKVIQLPAGESTAKQEALQTTQASHAHQVFSTDQTPVTGPTLSVTQKPNTTSITIVPGQASTVSQIVVTSQILDATQTSLSEQERSQAILISPTAVGGGPPAESHTGVAKSTLITESPQCLLLDTALPFCSYMVGEQFGVPNHLNQSSVEEVQATLKDWAWLLSSRCHHSLEWFFCLLLVPKCGAAVPLPALPCRSFCEVLRDSCWMVLDEGRLPVECHTLPDDEEDDGYQCLSVSNQKGNHWFKKNLRLGILFEPALNVPSHLPSLSGVTTQYPKM